MGKDKEVNKTDEEIVKDGVEALGEIEAMLHQLEQAVEEISEARKRQRKRISQAARRVRILASRIIADNRPEE